MGTFFVLWNPARWSWPDFDAGIVHAEIASNGGYDEPWSTGNRRQGMSPGDRVFLRKTGGLPRGLVAAGVASSDLYQAPHWDPQQGGNLAWRIDVTWTEAVDPADPLPYERLREHAPGLPAQMMTGGVRVDASDAGALEGLWNAHRMAGGDADGVEFRGRVVTRSVVMRVLEEYDDLGRSGFLDKYGFGPSRLGWLEQDGRFYDPGAVLCAAAGLDAVASGERVVQSVLDRLGFRIASSSPRSVSQLATQRPEFRVRNAAVVVAGAARGQRVDPDRTGRGVRAHRDLENWLATRVRAAGLDPVDARPVDPQFDLAWQDGHGLTVVEVKSLTAANEMAQMRLGLGQLLEYRHLLGTSQPVRAVLFVERKPSATHWGDVCSKQGVSLWWPGASAISIGTVSDAAGAEG